MNNKRRGTRFERELVNKAKLKGLVSKRAYASNGESLGEVKEVDLLISTWRIQAKKRKKLPSYLRLDEGVDAVVFSEDREDPLVLLPYSDFLDLLVHSNLLWEERDSL